ncbi:MAG TPA: hypothetical protein EYQ71_05375 [Candidatus Thioglobus sp.]|nr:hypothetical protein [Candidatus Thioglobus sp.]
MLRKKTSEYNSGFIASFDSHKALLEYNEHPEHSEHQGIIVFDIEI